MLVLVEFLQLTRRAASAWFLVPSGGSSRNYSLIFTADSAHSSGLPDR